MRGVTKFVNEDGESAIVPINLYTPSTKRLSIKSPTKTDVMMYSSLVDNKAYVLADPDRGRIVVTGGEGIGKSFLIDQILYRAQSNINRFKLQEDIFPIVMSMEDFNNLAPMVDDLNDYFVTVAEFAKVETKNICVITSNIDIAGRILDSSCDVKMILEASEVGMSYIEEAKNRGITYTWNSVEKINLSQVSISMDELAGMVSSVQSKVIKDTYNVSITKALVRSLVDEIVRRYGKLVDKSKSVSGGTTYVRIPPGVLTEVVKNYATLANKFNAPTAKEKSVYIEATVDMSMETLISYSDQNGPILKLSSGGDNVFRIEGKSLSEQILGEINKQIDFDDALFGYEEETEVDNFNGKFRTLNSFEKRLKKAIIGQDHVIDRVVNGLSIPIAGLSLPNKPLRTFLFLGPTGVGKTELSLQIAKNLYTEEMHVVRLDMSEYSTDHSNSSLFGAKPGYIGYEEEGGMLTREVMEYPHSLIILDEVEKAHCDIWDSFLQVFSAARMTTGSGRVVDFSKCIIVMTSNLGTKEMSASKTGFSAHIDETTDFKTLESIANSAVKSYFRPEFINRIDDIVVFRHISKDTARMIADRELGILKDLMHNRGYSLEGISTDILNNIIEDSNFNLYGARDIQRCIDKGIRQPVAKAILESKRGRSKKLRLERVAADSSYRVL